MRQNPLKQRALWKWASVVAVAGILMFGSYLFGRSQSPAGIVADNEASVALYAEALERVQDSYVDQGKTNPRAQTYAAIEGMLDSLGDDGHTRFLTPEEVAKNQRSISGDYSGIGVTIKKEDGKAVVSAPIPGSPADKAGLQTGDVIVGVNGESVNNPGLSKLSDRIRGEKGTQVTITVERDGQRREFTVERAELKVPTVTWEMIPDSSVAHIRLSSFSKNTADQLDKAMSEAQKQGAKKFVLDLRSNPGGVLEQTTQTAGEFLEPGKVVYIRRDASGERTKVRVPDDARPTGEPVVVLVDGGTASSAEILAGALRDNGRAEVVGEQTFGTGTVLKPFKLDDGSEILLGVAEWLTPDGDFIRENGIQPDTVVKLGENEEPVFPSQSDELSRKQMFQKDPQLQRAFQLLK